MYGCRTRRWPRQLQLSRGKPGSAGTVRRQRFRQRRRWSGVSHVFHLWSRRGAISRRVRLPRRNTQRPCRKRPLSFAAGLGPTAQHVWTWRHRRGHGPVSRSGLQLRGSRGSRAMKIYWIKAQAPRRVLALVKHLGIDAELVEVDAKAGGLKSPDYAVLNPNLKAPTLVDGGQVLWESSAIMAYLCIKAGSDMWPVHDAAEQTEVLRWLSWNDCHWSPAVGPFYFEHVVRTTFGLGPPDREALKPKVEDLKKYATVLYRHLAS